MSWNSLGIVVVVREWQLWGTATTASTFRLSFLGELDRVWYHARMRQYFSADEVSLSIRLYPKAESLILELPVPQQLQTQGLAMRHLGVRKYPNRRYTVPDSNWQIELEEWV